MSSSRRSALPQNGVTDLNALGVARATGTQASGLPSRRRLPRQLRGQARHPSTRSSAAARRLRSGSSGRSRAGSDCFRPAHPLGIDVDLFANPSAVAAAAAGRVVLPAATPAVPTANTSSSLHGNGFRDSVRSLLLDSRQPGTAGRSGPLGYGGRTGYATGNHTPLLEVHSADRWSTRWSICAGVGHRSAVTGRQNNLIADNTRLVGLSLRYLFRLSTHIRTSQRPGRASCGRRLNAL
jgi:hypothetical protein